MSKLSPINKRCLELSHEFNFVCISLFDMTSTTEKESSLKCCTLKETLILSILKKTLIVSTVSMILC